MEDWCTHSFVGSGTWYVFLFHYKQDNELRFMLTRYWVGLRIVVTCQAILQGWASTIPETLGSRARVSHPRQRNKFDASCVDALIKSLEFRRNSCLPYCSELENAARLLTELWLSLKIGFYWCVNIPWISVKWKIKAFVGKDVTENVIKVEGTSAYEIWEKVFTADVVKHIVLQTNLYANRDNNPRIILLSGYHTVPEERHY